MEYIKDKTKRRRHRNRARIRQRGGGRLRLSVHRSGKHIYAQIIDDHMGKTVCAASTMDKAFRVESKSGRDVKAAGKVGMLIAERAIAQGVKEVVFDRGEFRFHGRVKALAEGAREGGLSF